jgi:hypothetical protein
MTYALREAYSRAARTLAAPIALLIALVAHAALGLSGEPFHADGKQRSMADGRMPLYLGAGERIRTADLPFTRRLLCQLSYTGGELPAC